MTLHELMKAQLLPVLGQERAEALVRTVRVMGLCGLKGNFHINPMSERGFVVALDPIPNTP